MNCTNCWAEVPGDSAQCPDCGTLIDATREEWTRQAPAQRRGSNRRRRRRRLALAVMIAVAATYVFRTMQPGTLEEIAALVTPTSGTDSTGPTVMEPSVMTGDADEGSVSEDSPLARLMTATEPAGSAASAAREPANEPGPDRAVVPFPSVRPHLLAEGLGRPAARTTAVMRVGGDVTMPVKKRDVDPTYPRLARAAHVKGGAVLEAVIDTEGRLTDIRVVKSVRLLDEAALDAVGQWQYEPARLNGVAVPVLATITVRFSL